MNDDFRDPVAPGRVIGSRTDNGVLRSGRDVESRLSIDHGALRIATPQIPGPGRHALTYGPFARTTGLAFAACVLNGHHGSRTAALDPQHPTRDVVRRLFWKAKRVVRDVTDSLGLTSPERRRFNGPLHITWPPIIDNLAVGWFRAAETASQTEPLHGFVVRSADAEGGALRVMCQGRQLEVLGGVQNIPILYLVHLREAGATYYACSLAGASGLPQYPELRPVALDSSGSAPCAVAGLDQRILGEIGFSVDTRVFGTRVASIGRWRTWYGGAHVADRLDGFGLLAGTPAERGGLWSMEPPSARRTEAGTVMDAVDHGSGDLDCRLATVDPERPSGLVHVWITSLSRTARGGLWFRGKGPRGLAVVVDRDGASVLEVEGQHHRQIAHDPSASMRPGSRHCVLVTDDGERLTFTMDGRRILEGARIPQTCAGTELGIMSVGPGTVRFSRFEAHPRVVELPSALRLDVPWWEPPASRAHVIDGWGGPPGDLHGSSLGGIRWERTLGRGVIELDGEGAARVRASPGHPNPGRTLYTIPWADPDLADLEVDLTLPGTAQGEGQLGRGGLVLWQDPDHYLVVNVWNDDTFPGSSVSSFLTWGGFEDLYRAVWSNVGSRLRRGIPHRLRMISDGHHYRVLVDDEPVLQRATTDIDPAASGLHVRRVGLAVNWEFGDDTGTVFRRFVARRSGSP